MRFIGRRTTALGAALVRSALRVKCTHVTVVGAGDCGSAMATVVMYTTQYCPYCIRAKALLRRKGIPFEEIDVSEDDGLRAKVVAASGRRTVPQIFINDQAVGGFDELRALDEQGALDRLLAA